MVSFDIFFTRLEEVDAYLKIVEPVPGELLLHCGDKTVNGKSLMGILSLDLSKPLTLDVPCSEEAGERLRLALSPLLA